MEFNARVMDYLQPTPNIDFQRVPQLHRAADMVANLRESCAVQPQMTARLAAAERRSFRQEMKRRPDLQGPQRPALGLDMFNAKPQSPAR